MLDIDEYLFFLGIQMLALISPGPDFLIVSRHALKARRLGVITGIGIATGLLFHISYCILGLGYIIAESPKIFMSVKYTGAAYLSFIGLLERSGKPCLPHTVILTRKVELRPNRIADLGISRSAELFVRGS